MKTLKVLMYGRFFDYFQDKAAFDKWLREHPHYETNRFSFEPCNAPEYSMVEHDNSVTFDFNFTISTAIWVYKTERPTVNWASIGTVSPECAKAFASAMLEASKIAGELQ